MNSLRPNNLSLKYQMFTSSDCKDIEIRHLEFVTGTKYFKAKVQESRQEVNYCKTVVRKTPI